MLLCILKLNNFSRWTDATPAGAVLHNVSRLYLTLRDVLFHQLFIIIVIISIITLQLIVKRSIYNIVQRL